MVKEEIQLLKANKIVPVAAVKKKVTPASPSGPGEESPRSAEPEFKGDHTTTKEGGDTSYVLSGRKGGTEMMTLPLEDLKKRFPNGLRVRFQYKSSGFVGRGVEMRMVFPSLRGLFTYRNPTLTFDGEWNEYLWPFSDTKDQDMMNFQILLEEGEGTVAFKNFEFLAN